MELTSEMAEAKLLRSGLNQTERKLREAIFESRRLKREAEQGSAAWMERETGFLNWMKAFEDELDDLKRENERLTQLQRTARGETSKLRDIINQAVNEATVVKEALEIARGENSRLKDSLKEMQHITNRLKEEYECLRVGEAASTDSVKELIGMLAAVSLVESNAAAEGDKGRKVSWGSALVGWEWKETSCLMCRRTAASAAAACHLQFGDATWEWEKQRKRKKILRSLSDILKKKKSKSLDNRR